MGLAESRRVRHCSPSCRSLQGLSDRRNIMNSPFRGLRRGASGSSGSLNAAPFSYPYPRTHTTLVVPASVLQQRERPVPADDSPTALAAPAPQLQPRPFHRPPLNRAIPPIPESKSNESIISQASHFSHRHSISDSSAGCSQRETLPQPAPLSAALYASRSEVDTSVVIENRMAHNLAARRATNLDAPVALVMATPSVTKRVTARIMTSKSVSSPVEPPASSAYARPPIVAKKPTRLPVATKSRVSKVSQQTNPEPPKSPLLSMAHTVRNRLNKLGNRLGRTSSRSPIKSSYSMVTMKRDRSDLDNKLDVRLAKSSSMDTQSTRPSFIPPPPPTSSPPNEEDLAEQPGTRPNIVTPRYVSSIPRRLPTTTLIPSPMGVYPRRLLLDEAPKEEEGPILAIDSREVIRTPDENVPPSILLRKQAELTPEPLQNGPTVMFIDSQAGEPHSTHSLPRRPKATAHLIVRQPSEPAYQTHRRTKSGDVAAIRRKPLEPGAESVKTTRSLKITYRGDDFTPLVARRSHKKSSSVDISKLVQPDRKLDAAPRIQPSASASRADEMRLHKRSFIPKRFELRAVHFGHARNRKAPLAPWESSRVKDSPASEQPPTGFAEAELANGNKRSPSKARRIAFWKSRSSKSEETEAAKGPRKGVAKQASLEKKAKPSRPTKKQQEVVTMDSLEDSRVEGPAELVRTVTTARIITKPVPGSPDENGNVPVTQQERDRSRLTLNDILSSPLTSHRRTGETQIRRALLDRHRSGLIDDEIDDQPMLISTELSLIDEHSEHTSTPLSAACFDWSRSDPNRNVTFQTSVTEQVMTLEKDSDGNFVRAETARTGPTTHESHELDRTQLQGAAPKSAKGEHHDHAAIEQIIEDLSQQLVRIRQFAIEDEDEMDKLRLENNSLKEELEIKDRVIGLLMNKLKEPQQRREQVLGRS